MDLFRSSEALKGLKAFTVFSSGLYAGSVLYVSTVDHDTRKATIKVVSPEAAMTNFKMTHDRIEKIVVPLYFGALLGGAATYFSLKDDPRQKYWLTGASTLSFVLPLTMFYINPTYKHPICKDPKGIAAKGPDHAAKMLDDWNFRGNGVRALLGIAAFAFYVSAFGL